MNPQDSNRVHKIEGFPKEKKTKLDTQTLLEKLKAIVDSCITTNQIEVAKIFALGRIRQMRTNGLIKKDNAEKIEYFISEQSRMKFKALNKFEESTSEVNKLTK